MENIGYHFSIINIYRKGDKMKITVLGGGGVRSPFLAKSLVSNAERVGITEIVFMDSNEEKLNIYGKIAKKIAESINPDIKFWLTSDPIEAIKDTNFVVTTIRVGEDAARVLDERVALRNGVLGQETTGAGGFAMALRSIPKILEYCELIKQHAAKDALLFNFTNPSGIVTQAIHVSGFKNVYGICDAPSEFIKQIASLLEVPLEELSAECFGLNHLSWFRNVKVNGQDVMEKLLAHKDLYTETEMKFFEPELVRISENLLLNEYLYYFYYRERAEKAIMSSDQTRGETILDINKKMTKELKKLDIDKDFDKAFEVYLENYMMRENTYMQIESKKEKTHKWKKESLSEYLAKPDSGGYAGVALDIIQAFQEGKKKEMVVSVPNNGAIDFLEDDDVVEITCRFENNKINPIKLENIPKMQRNLIQSIKLYERLTVEASLEKNREKAVKALTVHPLVNSYSLAKKLVDEYLEAHKEFVGEWK